MDDNSTGDIRDDPHDGIRDGVARSSTRGRTWMHPWDVGGRACEPRISGVKCLNASPLRRVSSENESQSRHLSTPAMTLDACERNECRSVETLKENYLLSPTNMNQYTRQWPSCFPTARCAGGAEAYVQG